MQITSIGLLNPLKKSFNSRISDLRKKASKKVYVLARVTLYMNISKRRIVMNVFFLNRNSG